jgi:hypothetical protein
MSKSVPPQHGEAERDQALACRIRQRTGGRVHDLRVRVSDAGVAVGGYAFSYHAKQLALAAVREVFAATPVQLDIEVLQAAPRAS